MSKRQTKKGTIFESELSKYMILRLGTLSKESLRNLTTVGSNVTMLKYFDDPETIPMGKMKEIMKALRVPKEEQLRIMVMLLDE